MRGECLGRGFVEGMGSVLIFHDTDHTDRLIVQPASHDGGETSVRRDRVKWRKSASPRK